jgi:hypothetical protein
MDGIEVVVDVVAVTAVVVVAMVEEVVVLVDNGAVVPMVVVHSIRISRCIGTAVLLLLRLLPTFVVGIVVEVELS